MLNYDNVGEVIKYDYLQGFITKIYPEDNTADVCGPCGVLSTVPIRYRCKNDSEDQGDGTFEDASYGFIVGDQVIVLKGIDDASSLGESCYIVGRYHGVKKCQTEVFFFQTYSIGSDIFLGVSNIEGVMVWTYDLNDILGKAGTSEIFIECASSDANAILVLTGTDTWRMPIFWLWEDQDMHDVRGGSPYPHCISTFSSIAPGGYRTSFWSPWLFGHTLDQEVGHVNFQVISVSGSDLDGDTFIEESEKYPLDYKQKCTEIRGMGWNKGSLIMGIFQGYDPAPAYSHPYLDENKVYCGIAAFKGPIFDDGGYGAPDTVWYFQAEPSWVDTYFERTILEIETIEEFEDIDQIFCHDDRLFVFRGTRSGLPSVSLYTIDGELITVFEHQTVSEVFCCKAYVIKYKGQDVLCAQWFCPRVSKSLLYMLNLDDLEVVHTVALPGSNTGVSILSLASVMVPFSTAFLYKLAQYRRDNGLKPVSYSNAATGVAQLHAQWCVENRRASHDGLDDKSIHDRQREAGFFNGAENLAIVVSGLPETEIEQAFRFWDESPEHRANLLYEKTEGVGVGMAAYPYDCHVITIGPGLYNPETHTYTSGDTAWIIPPKYYGRVSLYVYNYYIY